MRKFFSYGPLDTDLHYYVPREGLINQALTQLMGENPEKGGHYITVWAPRQAGKTWVMQRVLWRLQDDERFDVLKLELEHLKLETDVDEIARSIGDMISDDLEGLGLENIEVRELKDLYRVFHREVLDKPLILILDEFDALAPEAISGIASVFRNIYNVRRNEAHKPTGEKLYLLHGLALIGVRAVLGIESQSGSPFNVQRSLHIPNLTSAEVESMFRWYERESGQPVEQAVIDRVYYETNGQPGLVSWLGELLTETYNEEPSQPLDMRTFRLAYGAAINVLPNSNILNIISKAKQEPYRDLVLELFRTDEKIAFAYDDPIMNFLYLNGVIDWERESEDEWYVKFPCPFVQKRLFNFFSRTLFRDVGRLHPPFENLEDTITEERLNVRRLLQRYEEYLHQNRDWLLKDVPRRADLRPYEAVYHFNLYAYLDKFIRRREGQVLPEFPTGNGKVDLLIRYAGRVYGLEVKSYVDAYEYRKALRQAARDGKQLGLDEMTLVFFVEYVDDAIRARYEVVYEDGATGVTVKPLFIATGG